jgi:hypothetical protein
MGLILTSMVALGKDDQEKIKPAIILVILCDIL